MRGVGAVRVARRAASAIRRGALGWAEMVHPRAGARITCARTGRDGAGEGATGDDSAATVGGNETGAQCAPVRRIGATAASDRRGGA
ncbi:hypothetical protein BVI434_2060003 [Burkholderia vietnamiensis]|nr:hypothetical protein BVI434_2060003 [Burkholderia vietnamiensis]